MGGVPFLWPWANRIDGLSYWISGKKYAINPELGNVRIGPGPTPIHGLLVSARQWKVVRAEATATEAVLAGVYCQAPAHKCKWFSVKGLPARVCITHAGYYGVRPTRVNPRDFVAAGFVWKAQWRCVADPSLPARGTAVRIAGFG